MERVDWTQEDVPKCGDCKFARLPLSYLSYSDEDYLECGHPSQSPWFGLFAKNLRQDNGIDLGFEKCGRHGQFFERDADRLGWDFQNHPPIGAWRDEEHPAMQRLTKQ